MERKQAESANATPSAIGGLYRALQALVGLHRELLEAVRAERQAIAEADTKLLQDITFRKSALIESIRQGEAERMKCTIQLAALWKRPLQQLTLTEIIHQVQGNDLKTADQLRSVRTVLNTLVERTLEQNKYNRELVQKSLEHVSRMKANVLGEASASSETYNPYGKKKASRGESRLLSKEV